MAKVVLIPEDDGSIRVVTQADYETVQIVPPALALGVAAAVVSAHAARAQREGSDG